MRIQHNIAAMNAYRNYNNNTSSLSKNLEKLSSGYKINRAGDDAAGLAISEKMRAQITGLNAAQKNVKDGVSLVKTAEGAMQEIQDMLNRMDYLATQSANGTYDKEVDRANLQKEVDALKEEINRIADAANFNGIKLLDGSLDANKAAIDATTTETNHDVTVDMSVGGALPGVGDTLGVDTVLHKNSVTKNGSEFVVNLHDFEFSNQKGDEMTVTIGEGDQATTITLKSKADHLESDNKTAKTLTGDDLVDALMGKSTAQTNYDLYVNGKQFSDGDKVTIKGQDFSLEKVNNNGKPAIKFTQDAPPVDSSEEVNPAMKVTVRGDVAATKAKYSFTAQTVGANTDLIIGDEKFTNGTTDITSADDIMALINNNSKNWTATTGANNTVVIEAKTGGANEKPDISIKANVKGAGATTATTVSNSAVTGKAAVAATVGGVATGMVTGGTLSLDGQNIISNWNGSAASGTLTTSDGVQYDWSISGTGSMVLTAKVGGLEGNNILEFTATSGSSVSTATATLGGGADAVQAAKSYDLSGWTSGDIKIGDRTFAYEDTIDGEKVGISGKTYNVSYDGSTLTLTAVDKIADGGSDVAAPGDTVVKYANQTNVSVNLVKKGSDAVQDKFSGDYNVSTTDIKHVAAPEADRLASTYFTLTDDMVREGSKLRIGDDVYTFTADKSKLESDKFAIDISSGDLSTIAKNLTDAAYNNATWTVGHDGNRITLTEAMANDEKYVVNEGTGKVTYNGSYDLRTEEGIKKSLGFEGVSYTTTETTEAQEGGKPLTLQIGDTSEDFNQMKVSIGDMHVDAMKLTDEETGESSSIADIDISNQEGAAKAVDVIKNAINYVSSVRGDLGAIQNRLEHTQNNLSVMAENIQDAESTIRDTDVAEEMMSYVKNNILVQSAQAMLAQANQLPQGVLQLLG